MLHHIHNVVLDCYTAQIMAKMRTRKVIKINKLRLVCKLIVFLRSRLCCYLHCLSLRYYKPNLAGKGGGVVTSAVSKVGGSSEASWTAFSSRPFLSACFFFPFCLSFFANKWFALYWEMADRSFARQQCYNSEVNRM